MPVAGLEPATPSYECDALFQVKSKTLRCMEYDTLQCGLTILQI